MGRLVNLWKHGESETSVVYRYGPENDRTGRLVINKETGEVSVVDAVSGMSAEESWFFYGMLAKAKAQKMFREGVYPATATMAT